MAWPASWHTVTTIRTTGQARITQAKAANAITRSTDASGAGAVAEAGRQSSCSSNMWPVSQQLRESGVLSARLGAAGGNSSA